MSESIIKGSDGLTYQSWVSALNQSEKRRGRGLIVAGAGLAALALLVSGCAPDNYEGNGHEFEIQGQVVGVGDSSVKVKILKVIEAEGRAASRYLVNGESNIGKETRVHDNYEGSWCEESVVGQEFDYEEREIDLADIAIGEFVDIIGNIRDKKDSCGKYATYSERPVYEEVRKIGENQLGMDFDLIRPQDSGYSN